MCCDLLIYEDLQTKGRKNHRRSNKLLPVEFVFLGVGGRACIASNMVVEGFGVRMLSAHVLLDSPG